LRAILEEVLLEVMYDLPSRSDVTQCVVDKPVVEHHESPTLVTGDDEERRTARVLLLGPLNRNRQGSTCREREFVDSPDGRPPEAEPGRARGEVVGAMGGRPRVC